MNNFHCLENEYTAIVTYITNPHMIHVADSATWIIKTTIEAGLWQLRVFIRVNCCKVVKLDFHRRALMA